MPGKKNIVYYCNKDKSSVSNCSDAISLQLGCTYTIADSWTALTKEIEAGAKFIAFNADYFENKSNSIYEFINAIFTMAEQLLNHTVTIRAVIKRNTNRSLIPILKRSKINGILLDIDDFPIEEVCTATASLLSNMPYWPKHIINALPARVKLPLTVFFLEDWKDYINPAIAYPIKENAKVVIDYCSDLNELEKMLSRNPSQLIFDYNIINRLDITISEFISMLDTRLKLSGIDIPIGVSIDPSVCKHVIKELKRSKILGIVPSAIYWGPTETITALNSLLNGESYWPKHIIAQLPYPDRKKLSTNNGITLTVRQGQVLTLLKERGASNKVIARSLNISESTVKLHISEMLRKYRVSSRAQLMAITA